MIEEIEETEEVVRDYRQERKEQAQDLVKHITSHVNSFSTSHDDFNEAMNLEHRTLQQSFTRLCMAWLDHCASPDYGTDPRNKGSQELALKIKRLLAKEDQFDCPLSSYLNMI